MKLSEIARIIEGSLNGKDAEILGVSDLDLQKENTIAYAVDAKNLEILEHSPVSAVILPEGLSCASKPFIRTSDPKLAFIAVAGIFTPYKPYRNEIYPAVYIEKGAKLGLNVTVLPFTSIMDNASIGDNTVIYSHVFIGKNVIIGKNCIIKAGVCIDDETVVGDGTIIHHNAVIGGDGFGYIQKDKKNIKIPQIGRIVIGSNVEIGACTTVDRAAISETVIGDGVKIDNLVQIGHNVKIGEQTVIMSGVGISGSDVIGARCILTGQVGIADHATIGDDVIVLAQSGVQSGKKIESNSILFGSPAVNAMDQRRIIAAMTRLPDMVKTISKIKKILGLD